MAKRTVRKQGSLKELVPGQKYLIKLFVGWVRDPKNPGRMKRKYLTMTFRGTRSEAQAELDKHVRAKTDGSLDLDSVNLTVGAYLERWIEQVSELGVRQSTSEKQAAMLRADVMPLLGGIKLASLSTKDVDKLIAVLQKDRDLSARTVLYYVATLSKALNKAVTWGLLNANPVKGASLPRVEPTDLVVLEPAELIRFQKTALKQRHGAPLLMLLANTGARPAEAYALRWKDVDLSGARLHINRSLVRFAGGYKFDRPKTKRSQRAVAINASLVKVLSALKEASKASPSDLVFPNTTGQPLHGSFVYHKLFKPVRDATPKLDPAKRKGMRLYDLRHTHATYLLLQNTHPKVVSERLGHATVQITLDTYSHVLPSMQVEAALVVEDLFQDGMRNAAVALQRNAEVELAPLKKELLEALDEYCAWLGGQ